VAAEKNIQVTSVPASIQQTFKTFSLV